MAPKRLPKFLEAGELAALIEAARGSSARDLALVLLMARAGLRVSEACGLRWGDVEEGQLWVRQGKGSKDRLVPLHFRVATALRELRNSAISRSGSRSTPVFPGRSVRPLTVRAAEYVIKSLGVKAGLPNEKCHPHSLRHAFAVGLLEAGVDIRSIQKLLGHSSLNTTAVYLDLTSRHLRAAVEKLS